MSATCNCPPDPSGFDCEHPQWVDAQCQVKPEAFEPFATVNCAICQTPLTPAIAVFTNAGIYCVKCKPLQGNPTEEVRSVSATGGEKGTKLQRYDLIPALPLRLLAEHYGVGARKYADRNWERGYEWSKSFAALNRHLWQFWNGENNDAETGSPHIIAVAWHAFALAEFAWTHREYDDRPLKEKE